jgi:hypothetical protein
MLYIKFKIQDFSKFTDFQKLYDHMVEIRQPGFAFAEEKPPEFDWDKLTKEEADVALIKLDDFFEQDAPEIRRYQKLIPRYANEFLERYLQIDNEKTGLPGILETLSILNYLEYGFEVDLENLEKPNEDLGLVEFSARSYPYGGMERFLMTLKAFELIPTECYNGFTVYEFDWVSDFEHHAIELPEKTTEYLSILKP